MKLLIINLLLGSILLFSYYYLSINKNIDSLWGSISKSNRKYYFSSMIIVGISYLVILYLLTKNQHKISKHLLNKILLMQILLIVFSMAWMPLSYSYLDQKTLIKKYSIIVTLGIVALCSLFIVYFLNKINNLKKITKRILLLCAILFFGHVFVLDFLLWNYNFF